MTQRAIRHFVIKATIALLFVVGAYVEAGPLTAVAIGLLFCANQLARSKRCVNYET